MSNGSINDIHQFGRTGVGVSQGVTSADYPLVAPSIDIRHLLADFYMAFDSPADRFTHPFRISRISSFDWTGSSKVIGSDIFGTLFRAPDSNLFGGLFSSYSTINLSHLHGIQIVDAENRVVFDSAAEGVTHEFRDWGDRTRVVTWRHPTDQIVSMVYHTHWGPDNEPEPVAFPEEFSPTAAELDERTIQELPQRVRSLTVVLDNFRQTGVEFAAGYNMLIDSAAAETGPGQRNATTVTFAATPGSGLGVFPGCEPEPLVIRTINGVKPTDEGDFFLSAADCYWIRQPTTVVSTVPPAVLPNIQMLPGSVPSNNLPAANAGKSKTAAGWPVNDSPAYAHLQIGNDCVACCDCPDYVAAAEYMNYTREKWHDLGEKFEASRDQFHINRERWLASLDCFNRRPLRVKLLAQVCPYLDVAIQFCNQTEECQTEVELIADFSSSPVGAVGTETAGYTFIRGGSTAAGRRTTVEERVRMSGDYPRYTAFFDAVQPGQSVYARFRLQFDGCGAVDDVPFAITADLSARVRNNILMVRDKETGLLNIPASATETRTLNCPVVPGDTSNLLICACES